MVIAEIPPFVIATLEQVGYASPYYKPVTDAFMERWGDLERSTFVRTLQEGEGLDKLISIFAMTNNDTDQVRQLLLSSLQSSPLELKISLEVPALPMDSFYHKQVWMR